MYSNSREKWWYGSSRYQGKSKTAGAIMEKKAGTNGTPGAGGTPLDRALEGPNVHHWLVSPQRALGGRARARTK